MANLDKKEKGIVKYLGTNYDESLSLNDITQYLKDVGYEDTTRKNVLEKIDNLIDLGYVRSRTKGKGDNREEKFYLSKSLLGGRFKRRGLQGRGFLHDTSSLIERLFGSVFVLFGLGVLIYEGLNITGAVISNGEGIGISSLLGLTLMIIGGILIKKH